MHCWQACSGECCDKMYQYRQTQGIQVRGICVVEMFEVRHWRSLRGTGTYGAEGSLARLLRMGSAMSAAPFARSD